MKFENLSDYLKDSMKAAGMNSVSVAYNSGLSYEAVNSIRLGRKGVTADSAHKLQEAIGLNFFSGSRALMIYYEELKYQELTRFEENQLQSRLKKIT